MTTGVAVAAVVVLCSGDVDDYEDDVGVAVGVRCVLV